jgi:hypothetical protein
MPKKATKTAATPEVAAETVAHRIALSATPAGLYVSQVTAYAPIPLGSIAVCVQLNLEGTDADAYVTFREPGEPQICLWQGDVPPVPQARIDAISGFPVIVDVLAEAAELVKLAARSRPLSKETVADATWESISRWSEQGEAEDESGLHDDGEYNEVGELVSDEYEPPEAPVEPSKKGKTSKNKAGYFDVEQEVEPKILKTGKVKVQEELPDGDDVDAVDDYSLDDLTDQVDSEEYDSELDDDDDDESVDPDDLDSEYEETDDETEKHIQDLIDHINSAKTKEELMEFGLQLKIPTAQMRKCPTVKVMKELLVSSVIAGDSDDA